MPSVHFHLDASSMAQRLLDPFPLTVSGGSFFHLELPGLPPTGDKVRGMERQLFSSKDSCHMYLGRTLAEGRPKAVSTFHPNTVTLGGYLSCSSKVGLRVALLGEKNMWQDRSLSRMSDKMPLLPGKTQPCPRCWPGRQCSGRSPRKYACPH